MIVDYEALAALYSRMIPEEFALVQREDLTPDARACYDREMERRVPGWRYEGPMPAQMLQKLNALRRSLKRQLVLQSIGLSSVALYLLIISWRLPAAYSSLSSYYSSIVTVMTVLGGFALLSSSYRTGYTVLWLRRFHRPEQKTFQRSLDAASRLVCMPITVRDSSFRSSYGFAAGQIGRFVWLALPVAIFAPLLLNEVTWDIIALILWLTYSIALMTYRWWAFTKINQMGPVKHLARLLEDIRRGDLRSGGALILRVQDCFWRAVVELAISRSNAIVIDVTDPSENLIWELRTAMRLRAPESVLLTCSTDSSPKISPEVVRSRLQQGLGEVDLSPFPFFFYSKADRPRVRIKELREVLTQCIAHGPVIED